MVQRSDVLFSTAIVPPLAYARWASEVFVMPASGFLSESPPAASRTVRRGSDARSLWAVNQRLANIERELRTQFIRIAQLQAQVDLVLGALRDRRLEFTCEERVSGECATRDS